MSSRNWPDLGRERPAVPLSPVRLANTRVPITTACRLVGVDIDGVDHARSLKTYCPFGGLYHSDGGAEPAFRIYPQSNSAYCFACAVAYSPVKLVARAFDLSYRGAADKLLEHLGQAPRNPRQAWAAATDAGVPPPERTYLAEALKIYCARICPDWATAQFEPAIAAVLTRALALLAQVGDQDEAATWLNGCKTAMAHTLAIYDR